MDDDDYKKLAQDAWMLYALTCTIQKMMNRIFLQDFIDLDKEEARRLLAKEISA